MKKTALLFIMFVLLSGVALATGSYYLAGQTVTEEAEDAEAPVWSYGESKISTTAPTWSYGESYVLND
jgi:hypothetical protein